MKNYKFTVAKEITFPERVSISSYSWVGNNGICGYKKNSLSLYNRKCAFPLMGSSTNRSDVTGKSQTVWVDQSIEDGKVQELLFIELKNKGEGLFGFSH